MTDTTIPSLYRDPEVRRLARELNRLGRDVRTLGRASQAAYRSSDGTGNDQDLGDYDDEGNALDPQGHTDGWVPPTPTLPDINPYREAVEVIWDGTFDDAEWDPSIANVLVHVLPDVGSVPEEATVVGSFGQEGGVFPYNVTLDEPIQYVALQAISNTGVTGQWSFPVAMLPLLGVDPADLAELQDDLTELNDVVLPSLQTDLSELNGLFPIQSTSIADGAITTPKIIVGTLLGDRVTANTLSGNTVIANTLYGDRIIFNTLSGDRIIVNTLSGDRIIVNTLSGDRIIVGTLNANRIDATTLNAALINAGTITGVTITGSVITGGTLQTATFGQRVVIDSSNLAKFYDSGGTLRGNIAGTATGMRLTGIGTAFVQIAGTGVGIAGHTSMDSFESGGDSDVNGDLTVFRLFGVSPTSGTAIPNARWSSEASGGELRYTSHANSSERYKKDIFPLTDILTAKQVLTPQPVRHKLRVPASDRPADYEFWGLIAEHMHDAGLHQFLGYDKKNRPDEVDWAKFAAVGHQVVLIDHDSKISGMMGDNKTLKREVKALKKELAALKAA